MYLGTLANITEEGNVPTCIGRQKKICGLVPFSEAKSENDINAISSIPSQAMI